jgi:hypothetical protein
LGKVAPRFAGERRIDMHWYNPKKKVAETVSAPCTDEEAGYMLGGGTDSWAFVAEYRRLRGEGMGVEQAIIFVGHRFRMWHLRYLPVG